MHASEQSCCIVLSQRWCGPSGPQLSHLSFVVRVQFATRRCAAQPEHGVHCASRSWLPARKYSSAEHVGVLCCTHFWLCVRRKYPCLHCTAHDRGSSTRPGEAKTSKPGSGVVHGKKSSVAIVVFCLLYEENGVVVVVASGVVELVASGVVELVGSGVVELVVGSGVVEVVIGSGVVELVVGSGVVELVVGELVVGSGVVELVVGSGVVVVVVASGVVELVVGSGVVELVVGSGVVELVVGSGVVELVVGSGVVELVVGSGVVELVVGSGVVELVVGSGVVELVAGSSHSIAPSSENLPASQSVHHKRPVSPEYVSALQETQRDEGVLSTSMAIWTWPCMAPNNLYRS